MQGSARPVLNICAIKLKYQFALPLGGLETSNNNNNRFSGPRRFGGPRPFRPSPVKVGDEYDVRIESMSRRGDSGVARVQGLVVFVSGAKVGDSVRVRITNVGSGYASGQVIQKDGGSDSIIESLAPNAEAETSGDDDE
jgi:predicted RNA-binding protein with TRAM domain